jgi:cation/acetate symporter
LFARAGFVRIARPISDFYVAGRLMPGMFNGMAIAASFAAVPVFVGMSGSLGPSWSGVSVVLLGGLAGLLLAGFLLAPYLRQFGGYTLPDFLAERFGGDKVRPFAVLAVILCSFPALAAVLLGLGLVVSAAYPVSLGVGVGIGVAALFLCTLTGGMRSLSMAQIAQYVLLLVGALVAIIAVLWQTGAIFDTEQLALDEVVPSFGVHVFAQRDAVNSFALMFCLAAGTASLPHLLMRSFTTSTAVEARTSFFASVIFVAILCLALPAYAALYEAAAFDSDAGLSMIAGAVLAVSAISGLLAAGSGLALVIGNTFSHDVYFKSVEPRASAQQLFFVARLCVVLVSGLAALAAVRAPLETLAGTSAALSLAASAFLPALVLGIWWKRASGDAALGGMAAGLVVCLYYMIAPHVVPIIFYESSSFLSDATSAQIAAYEELRQSYYLADEATKQVVLAKWQVMAHGIANWWGVRGAFAALFAVPVGFAVMIAVSLLTPAPSRDAQRFIRSLRERTA